MGRKILSPVSSLILFSFVLLTILLGAVVLSARAEVNYFSDDFESGLGNWIVSGQDWDLTECGYRSATHSLTDSPSPPENCESPSNYAPYMNASATLAHSIDLTTSTLPVLTFWHKYDVFDNTGFSRDFALVEISTDGGITWTELKSWSDISAISSTWSLEQIDLSNYKTSLGKIRFRLVSDGDVRDGWYIDDVEIKEKDTSTSYFFDNFEGENSLCSWIVKKGGVDFTATPNPCFNFNGWIGCDSSVGNQCTVSIDVIDRIVEAIFSCAPPEKPSLMSPANGATGVSTTPLLDWSDVPCATSYQVQVCSDSGCSSVVTTVNVTSSQWTVSPALSPITAYWRVKAKNSCGSSAWTEVWRFSTNCMPPVKPVLISPSNGSTGISTSPTLDWGDVSGATSYKGQVCTDSSCLSIMQTAAPTDSEWTVTPALSPGKLNYWRVKAVNVCGSNPWSNVRSFTTACPTVDVPGLMTPSNGTIGVSVSPTLDWNDVSGATSYKVQVCSDSSCLSTVASALTTSSQWTVTPALSPTTTYYWRVKAKNSCGSSVWSEVRSFKTKPTITVVSPNGSPTPENWQAGTTQSINWTYTGNPSQNVKIELLKSGVLNRTVTASTSIGSGGTGSYNWTIKPTQKSGCDYKIKMTSTTNSNVTDKSDKPFCIFRIMPQHQFPKLANQLQGWGWANETQILEKASFWDLLVVDVEEIARQPQYFGPSGILRKMNPSLVILSYFSAADVIPNNTGPVNQGFIQGLTDDWYMRDIDGQKVKLFEILPGYWTKMLNQTTEVNIFLPSYLQEKVVSTGLTDGIFYDWAVDSISWLNHRMGHEPLDINNDGVVESDTELDSLWISGFSEMLQNSRNTFPVGILIFGNKGWVGGNSYDHLLNGMMTEGFLEGEQYDGFDWDAVMRSYYLNCRDTQQPRLSFIMANRDTKEFKFMRYAFASALMFDGYFSFTNRSGMYCSTWWFDEYSVNLETGQAEKSLNCKGYLGQPLGDAFNSLNLSEKLKDVLLSYGVAKDKVWRRDFSNGIVLVNPSSVPVNVDLSGTFKKIKGYIDPEFNNGEVLNSIMLEAHSGIVLLENN